jgi:hypothetical protein
MSFRPYLLAASIVAAISILPSSSAMTQPAAWPAGKRQLPWIEGRWSTGDCKSSFTEYRFAGPDRKNLTFASGPAASDNKLTVDVYYDGDGNVVLYFPSISFRTIVFFKGKDLRDTMDIDKDGKVSRSTYRRCGA